MKFTIEEIVRATGAEVLKCVNRSGMFRISTDTRTIEYTDLFLPLSGENFDGHDFINKAVENGARGFFTAKKELSHPDAKIILYVKDPLKSYLRLARYCRRKYNPVTIAITGSSGKTTTKEMMASVMEQGFRTHKSKLNHNNEIGMCQTILSMAENTEVLVLEMGMRARGEIELLSKYAEPDIGVIVNTGTAHIGRLGSVENIARAKCEIGSYLHEEGVLIAHDSELIRKFNIFKGKTIYTGLDSPYLEIIDEKIDSSVFSYKGREYTLNVEGEYNIQDALFVIETAMQFGMTHEKIANGLKNYSPIGQRWEIQAIKGLKVINDSYNANPDSMKAAIKAFLSLYSGKKALVLGDMGELGENEVKYHEQVGEFVKKLSEKEKVTLITVGELARHIGEKAELDFVNFSKNEDAAKYILENLSESTTILFKASRSMKFEQIIEELKK